MDTLWASIKKSLRVAAEISGPREALLNEIKFVRLDDLGNGAVATLSLNSRLSVQMFERLLMSEFKLEAEKLIGKPISFEFEVRSNQESFAFDLAVPEVSAPSIQATQIQFKERFRLNPSFKLESFIPTHESSLAVRAVEHLISDQPQSFSVLALEGPSGVGKTHLLHAAGWRSREIFPNLRTKIVSGDEFITDFQSCIQKKNMSDFSRRYRMETDLLLVDDLHSVARAKGTQEELFNLMNHYASTGRKIIITCDRPIREVEGIEERISSRIAGGLIATVKHPSMSSRLEIFKSKIEKSGMNFSDVDLERLLNSAGPCVRSIDGLFFKLQLLAKHDALTPDAVNQIAGYARPVTKERLTALSIIQTVAEKHGLTVSDLKSKARARPFVEARRESMNRMRGELGLSASEIGRLHNRDHSTVLAMFKEG